MYLPFGVSNQRLSAKQGLAIHKLPVEQGS